MAKRFTHKVFNSEITLDLYRDEANEALLKAIRENLEPVLKNMEEDARANCPVSKKEKSSPTYWRGEKYLDDYAEKHTRQGRRRTVQRIKVNSKRGYIYKRDYSHKTPRTVGFKHDSREPGRLRASIRSAVYLRKDKSGVVAFLEAGNEDSFYASFVEYGTYKMNPRPFFRSSFARHAGAAHKAIKDALAFRK